MRARTYIAGVLAVLAPGLAGCGGGGPGPLPRRSPAAIAAASVQAIESVRSVRVTGQAASGGTGGAIRLDLRLVAGRGATGSLVENGLRLRLITIGATAYLEGSSAFWRQFAGSAVAARLKGRWLRTSADSGEFSSLSALTDLHKLIGNLVGGHGPLVRGPAATIAGRRALTLRDPSRGGILYVAASGPPYPLRILVGHAGGGRLDFSAVNAPVSLRAPSVAISLSRP